MLKSKIIFYILVIRSVCYGLLIENSVTRFSELISNNNYRLLEYTIVTDDGYLLKLHRVVTLDFNEITYNINRRPVILQHGIFGSSNNFFLNGISLSLSNQNNTCENNIGFCLLKTDRYDVWAGNSRGNGYSNGHVKKFKKRYYWEFSFDQMAKYDLPSTIDFIRKTTGHDKIGYVGHSQGALSMFALLVSDYGQRFHDVVQPFIAWGPPVYIQNMTSKARILLPLSPILEIPADVSTLGIGNYLLEMFCGSFPGGKRFICFEFIEQIYGKTSSVKINQIPEWFKFIPNPSSTWAVLHLVQLLRTGNFQNFDYGKYGNYKKYNQTKPPKYELEKFPKQVNVQIYSGITDAFIPLRNAKHLWYQIDPKKEHSEFVELQINGQWNHIDYLFSTYAGELLYNPTLKFLDANR